MYYQNQNFNNGQNNMNNMSNLNSQSGTSYPGFEPVKYTNNVMVNFSNPNILNQGGSNNNKNKDPFTDLFG